MGKSGRGSTRARASASLASGIVLGAVGGAAPAQRVSRGYEAAGLSECAAEPAGVRAVLDRDAASAPCRSLLEHRFDSNLIDRFMLVSSLQLGLRQHKRAYPSYARGPALPSQDDNAVPRESGKSR